MSHGEFDIYLYDEKFEATEKMSFKLESFGEIQNFLQKYPSVLKAIENKTINASIFYDGHELFCFTGKVEFEKSVLTRFLCNEWKKELSYTECD